MKNVRSPDSTLELGEIADPSEPGAAPYEPKPGDAVGAYVLEELLGRGGMGQVFQAYDPKLDRRVAIKLVTSHHVTSVPRFVSEARVTARCTHPNIVVIHDISEHQGRPFMVLEQLRGKSASQLLREGRMGVERALTVMEQVARALRHAHKQGIVHRDLKPANIFVTDDDMVKVLDFGIAKLLADPEGVDGVAGEGGSAPRGLEHTAVGQLVGTFEYMAPEQMTGGAVDHRADIWAFGLTTYQLIQGLRPFDGATELELLGHAKALDEPMPSLAAMRPDLPPAITRMVDRCLAKRAEDRPQDAGELLRAFRALHGASGASSAEEPISDPGRAAPVVPLHDAEGGPAHRTTQRTQPQYEVDETVEAEPPPRRRRLVLAAAALAAVAAAGLAVWWWTRPGPRPDDERESAAQVARLAAELDRHLAAGDRAGAESLVEAFVDNPAHARGNAAALAWQAWAERLAGKGDRTGALGAYANAYLEAKGDQARLTPLAAIADLYVAGEEWDRLGDVLAVLAGIPGGDTVAVRARVLHDLAQGQLGGEERAPPAWRGVARALTIAAPGPAPLRRVAPVQLDDDPDDELLGSEGTKVTAFDVGGAVTRRFDLPQLNDIRCATSVAEGMLVFGGRADGHSLGLHDRNGRDVSSTKVDGWRCNLDDRDGDGVPEVYVFGSGKLLELKLGRGADPATATRTTWSLGSESDGVVAVDHAAGRSLLIAVTEWRGYDLRLVDVLPDRTLHLRDRVRLGLVSRPQIVRRRDGVALHAALLQDTYPSRKALGAAAPAGAPQGLYLFEVTADEIRVRGRIEVSTANNAGLVVADLDGDGADELLVSACRDSRCRTAVIMLRDDDTAERFWINGIETLARVSADGDAADELAVVDDDRRLWVLGSGSTRLPPRGHPAPSAPRTPAGLDRAGVATWQRAEDLARIGLTLAAARSFRTLRSLATDPEVQDAALERAATLLAAGGDLPASAAAWAELAAARRGAPAATARLRAIEAHRDGHQLAAARPLVDALLADGLAALSPEERLRLDGLRAELAAPVIALVENGRPHDAWQVIDPTGFYRDPASGGLIVDSTTAAPVIASVGVRHAGGPLLLRFDLTMTRAEWAGEVMLELRPRGGDPRRTVKMGIRAGGGGQASQRLAGLAGGGAFIEGAHPLPSVDAPVRARLTLSRVAGDVMRVRWEIEGSPPWEQRARVAIPAGDYDLRVINDVPGEVASGVARVDELALAGFEVLPRTDAERAASEAAALLSRDDPRGALAALDRTPPADAWDGARLRAVALQLLGRTDEARAVLRAALAADPARRAERLAELAWLRRVRDGRFAGLARAAAGDDAIAVDAIAWKATGYQHLYEPRVQERLAVELADLPPGKGAAQIEARAQLHLLRGTALSVMKRTEEARAELERTFRTAASVELRQEAAIQLAVDAAATGDARTAWHWVEAGLDVAGDPLWVADQLLLDPAIRTLSERPDWGRLRRHGRVVPSDVRTLSAP